MKNVSNFILAGLILIAGVQPTPAKASVLIAPAIVSNAIYDCYTRSTKAYKKAIVQNKTKKDIAFKALTQGSIGLIDGACKGLGRCIVLISVMSMMDIDIEECFFRLLNKSWVD